MGWSPAVTETVTADVTYTAQWKRIYRPTPSTPTVEIPDDDALGLNTDDHFAYIIGYPDGTVQPNGQITRAETATMINRVLDRVPSEESHLLSRGVMQIWPDANPGDWFYLAMPTAMTTSAMPSGPPPTSSGRRWNSKQSGKKNGSTKCSRSFMLF